MVSKKRLSSNKMDLVIIEGNFFIATILLKTSQWYILNSKTNAGVIVDINRILFLPWNVHQFFKLKIWMQRPYCASTLSLASRIKPKKKITTTTLERAFIKRLVIACIHPYSYTHVSHPYEFSGWRFNLTRWKILPMIKHGATGRPGSPTHGSQRCYPGSVPGLTPAFMMRVGRGALASL